MNTIVLASSSPRRRELLSLVGIKFLIIKPSVNEIKNPNETINKFIKRISEEKANNVFNKIKTRKVVFIISADTIVVAPGGGEIFGKPTNKKHAKKMLSKLSGQKHTVLTAYTILVCKMGKILGRKTRIVSTVVWFRKIRKQEINKYVDTREPMDKAGAYAAQGLGMVFIEKIFGSYTNVVGLPVEKLVMDLKKLNYDKRRKKIRS